MRCLVCEYQPMRLPPVLLNSSYSFESFASSSLFCSRDCKSIFIFVSYSKARLWLSR